MQIDASEGLAEHSFSTGHSGSKDLDLAGSGVLAACQLSASSGWCVRMQSGRLQKALMCEMNPLGTRGYLLGSLGKSNAQGLNRLELAKPYLICPVQALLVPAALLATSIA